MKVYTSNDFPGHYVGTAAVIVAANAIDAREALIDHLVKDGLVYRDPVLGVCEHRTNAPCEVTVKQVPTVKPQVLILQNGDY